MGAHGTHYCIRNPFIQKQMTSERNNLLKIPHHQDHQAHSRKMIWVTPMGKEPQPVDVLAQDKSEKREDESHLEGCR